MSDTMVRSNRPTLPQRPFNPRGLNRLTKQTLVYLPRHRRQGRKLRRYCYAYDRAIKAPHFTDQACRGAAAIAIWIKSESVRAPSFFMTVAR